MITNITITHQCDLCKKETVTWDDDERLELEVRWYSNLTLDLCEECRVAPRGRAMISVAERQRDRLAERKSERLMLEHQPSRIQTLKKGSENK